jgi:tRNA(Arg) A34 adenosine deaminase TadA
VYQFNILLSASEFIKNISINLEGKETHTRADTLILHQTGFVLDIHENHRDEIAYIKRTKDERFLPIESFEGFLSGAIARGAKPWGHIKEFYQNLTEAMKANAQMTVALMQTLGIDMVLPQFPAMNKTQLKPFADLLEKRYKENGGYQDGIVFFIETLKEFGLLQNADDKTSYDLWNDMIKLLPSLEKHVDFEKSPDELQSREYYMQLVLNESNHGFHRRHHLGEHNETISSLVVRLSDATIVSVATNELIPETEHHKHAELLAVGRAREKMGKPTSTLKEHDIYVSCEPCNICGPILMELEADVFFGSHTEMGSGLFPTSGNILGGEFDDLFRKLGWNTFVRVV